MGKGKEKITSVALNASIAIFFPLSALINYAFPKHNSCDFVYFDFLLNVALALELNSLGHLGVISITRFIITPLAFIANTVSSNKNKK